MDVEREREGGEERDRERGRETKGGVNAVSCRMQGAGFTARVTSADSRDSGVSHRKSIRKWKLTFVFSLVFAIPTVIIAFVPVNWVLITPGLTAKEIVLFFLSTIVQVGGASQTLIVATVTQLITFGIISN